MTPDEPVTPPAPQHLRPHYTLAEAVRVFFPNGPFTVASLRNERPSAQPCGLSKTERIEKAQACAAALMTKKLNAPSPDTSPTNTNPRKSLTRSSTKS